MTRTKPQSERSRAYLRFTSCCIVRLVYYLTHVLRSVYANGFSLADFRLVYRQPSGASASAVVKIVGANGSRALKCTTTVPKAISSPSTSGVRLEICEPLT